MCHKSALSDCDVPKHSATKPFPFTGYIVDCVLTVKGETPVIIVILSYCRIKTKIVLGYFWGFFSVLFFQLSISAVPVQNMLMGTDDLLMWGVYRSSLKSPELLTDLSGLTQHYQTFLIFPNLMITARP